jgi:hypothetical protein
MKKLVETDQLRTNYWRVRSSQKGFKALLKYDDVLDTFFVYFSDQEKERIITHFVDSYVAFLYRYSDKEIIGMRIESFQKKFLPIFGCPNTWKLSDSGKKLDGIHEFVFLVKTENPSIKPRPIERSVRLNPVFDYA